MTTAPTIEPLTTGPNLSWFRGRSMLEPIPVDFSSLQTDHRTPDFAVDAALRQVIGSEFYDDVVFILNRIHSLPPEGSEHVQPRPSPNPSHSVRVSKSDISQAHDLNAALPGPWAEETGEIVLIWHTPAHWRYVEDQPLKPVSVKSESTADAWESYLFETNGLNWKQCVPTFFPDFLRNVPTSLRSWVKQAHTQHDPNYLMDERMTTPSTKGVIPPANTTAAVRWQYLHDPVAPRFDYSGSLSEDEIKIERDKLSRHIEAGKQAVQEIRAGYEQDPQTVADRTRLVDSAVPVSEVKRTGDRLWFIARGFDRTTPKQLAYWNTRIAEETRWQWMDERDKSIITWREAHTEAVESENELWTKILETDKKLYEPLRPRVFDELAGVRFVPPKHRTWLKDLQAHESESDLQNSGAVDSAHTLFSDDEERDPQFGTQGINYEGVRETYDHPDLAEVRNRFQVKYGPLKERIRGMTPEEQLEQAKNERDFSTDAIKYIVDIENRRITNIKLGGASLRANTLTQQMHRADARTEQAVLDRKAEDRGEIPLFTEALNGMTQEDVHKTVCPGGCFIVVVLNNTPELKYLGRLSMSNEEAEENFERVRDRSIRNAVKYARKTAQEANLGKLMTQERIEAGRKRIEQAYEQVTDIYRQNPCNIHHPKQDEVLVS